MIKENNIITICLKNGAHKASIIDVEDIPFDESLRKYCEDNKCGYFGKNYGCPPHAGETSEVIAEAKQYKKALVIQTISSIQDLSDYAGMKEAHNIHNAVSDRIKDEIALHTGDHLDLRAGACTVCEECTVINNEPCKYPEKKRISLEAYCINVSALAEKCGMTYNREMDVVSFFGGFLFR